MTETVVGTAENDIRVSRLLVDLRERGPSDGTRSMLAEIEWVPGAY